MYFDKESDFIKWKIYNYFKKLDKQINIFL